MTKVTNKAVVQFLEMNVSNTQEHVKRELNSLVEDLQDFQKEVEFEPHQYLANKVPNLIRSLAALQLSLQDVATTKKTLEMLSEVEED